MTMTKFRKLTSPALIVFGLLSACAVLKDPPEDRQINADVQARLWQDDRVSPGSIDVSTRNHVVYLSGLVYAPVEVYEAESIARQVPGVARVVNNLAIEQ